MERQEELQSFFDEMGEEMKKFQQKCCTVCLSIQTVCSLNGIPATSATRNWLLQSEIENPNFPSPYFGDNSTMMVKAEVSKSLIKNLLPSLSAQ